MLKVRRDVNDRDRSGAAGAGAAGVDAVAAGFGEHRSGTARLNGRVVANDALGTLVRLVVDVPGWKSATPGQFALLQAELSRCFLGRAFSVAEETGERIAFLIAPIGRGTEELCALAPGAAVHVLGPLGWGFDVDALVLSPGRAVLVGGGVGVAPFPLLLARMSERYRVLSPRSSGAEPGSSVAERPEVLVLLGFRDAEQAKGAHLVQEAAALMGEAGLRCRLEIAVEDGSRGPAEKVTDLLARHLSSGDRVAVCGPDAMATAVWKMCASVTGVDAWFSLEANMACGVGSCHGCTVRLANGAYARVCHEGPVFTGREVFGD
jgi:dihydroorotate dehydrogenase electron transfer subunit